MKSDAVLISHTHTHGLDTGSHGIVQKPTVFFKSHDFREGY